MLRVDANRRRAYNAAHRGGGRIPNDSTYSASSRRDAGHDKNGIGAKGASVTGKHIPGRKTWPKLQATDFLRSH